MQNIDKENLRQVILDFPKQFKVGFDAAKNTKPKGKFKALAVSGMGGSALPVDILKVYLSEKEVDLKVFQNRGYKLPAEAYENALNFFNSYSGGTEETLASLEEALKNKLPSVGFSAGGKLINLCQKNSLPYAVLPAGIQPRCATGYFFAAMLQVLINAGIVEDESEKIVRSAEKIVKNMSELEEQGKKIARRLAEKTPLIYASEKFGKLAMIWKIKLNENAKTPAFWNVFPELNHNEMVGFTLPQAKFHIVNLIDKADHPQNIKRMEITAKLLEGKGIETTFVEIEGSNVFEKIFSTLLIGDWASYHLALKYNQDPTPVQMVEDLKKLLAQLSFINFF